MVVLILISLCVGAVVYVLSQDGAVTDAAPDVAQPTAQTEVDTATQPIMQFGSKRIAIEYARTFEEKARGLSLRESLPPNTGMLFVFPELSRWAIWMKDMRFSIDIVWISDKGRVVHIEERISPDTFPNAFVPAEDARYVLEVPAGTVDEAGVSVGDMLIIPVSAGDFDDAALE